MLIISGSRDRIVPIESATRLAGMLRGHGMAVDHQILEAGHELTQEDAQLAAQWLKSSV